MLEHQKIVLFNVSENKALFKKELLKSLDWLTQDELKIFWQWLKQNYWETHGEIISIVWEKETGLIQK
jgi:hypothetical protein